jgi:hypothetical protein
MHKHSCIKCQTVYEDNDPDPYYCEKCVLEKKAIAQAVDAKLGTTSRRRPMSALQEYDASAKVRGFVHVRL